MCVWVNTPLNTGHELTLGSRPLCLPLEKFLRELEPPNPKPNSAYGSADLELLVRLLSFRIYKTFLLALNMTDRVKPFKASVIFDPVYMTSTPKICNCLIIVLGEARRDARF
jgi:hypothetical protein